MILVTKAPEGVRLNWEAYQPSFAMELTLGLLTAEEAEAVMIAHEAARSYAAALEDLIVTLMIERGGADQIIDSEAKE